MKRSRLSRTRLRKPVGKTAIELAVEFKVIQEQISDSKGEARKELVRQRDVIVKKYKGLWA